VFNWTSANDRFFYYLVIFNVCHRDSVDNTVEENSIVFSLI